MSDTLFSDWKKIRLESASEILFSNVDKKTNADDTPVLLCNYMDVYKNKYIKKLLNFMKATATVHEKKKFTVLKNDVLLTKDSEKPDDIAIPSFVKDNIPELVCGYHLAIIRPDAQTLSGSFLAHLLRSDFAKRYFYLMAVGTTRFGLGIETIKQYELSSPPVKEQQKIAEILTSVDEVIENTQSQIDKLEDLKKATMNGLLTKGIGHTEFKETEIGRIPKSWEVINLGDCFNLTSGKSKPTRLLSSTKTQLYKVPVYGGNGVTGYTESELLDKQTIVIGRVGEYCGSVHLTPRLCWITDNALYIKSIVRDFNLYFMFHLLAFIDIGKLRSEGGQPLVSQKPISDFVIALPAKSEQSRIADILDNLTNRIDLLSQKVILNEALKNSLMQDLLTGKVRVKVN